jgi:hypothetical protein
MNSLKMRSLGNRIFSRMCLSTGSYCTHLLYHSEVRWLSRGFVFHLIVALLNYVESFVCKESSLVLKFSFTKCILKLTYISFTFDEIKKQNIWCKALIRRWLGLQESLKLTVFRGTLNLGKGKVEENGVSSFPKWTCFWSSKMWNVLP